jgi:photosystem II stability/assembly factor-like uncharacterized protein
VIILFSFWVAIAFRSAWAAGEIQDDLFDVSFPTASQGWACGRWGTVIHTTDGGQTWGRQDSTTEYTLSSISFVDAQNGWAVGDRGTILHTTDAGATWKQQQPPTVTLEAAVGWAGKGGAAKVEDAPLTFFLMGVHFATPLKGWIVTERTHILYTEDGGVTWTVQFTGADIILQNVSFCDETTGWAVGEYGYIYHTADGGMTWEQQAGFFDISEETGDIVGGNYLFGVFAVDPQTAWAVGIDGYVVRTMDGGHTWEPVEKGIPRTHLFGVAVNRNGSVVIAGRSSLLVSADGGSSFTLASATPSIAYGWLFGLCPRGEGGLVAVGKSQWVYLSDKDPGEWKMAGRK